jgi:hypothetical protein
MTYIEIAKKVLRQKKEPLSYMDLWRYAENEGIVDKEGIQGKTPWNTMSAIISTDIKNNNNSIFTKNGSNPTLYGLKEWAEDDINNEDDIDGDDINSAISIDADFQDIDPIQDKWSVYDHIRKIKQGRLIIDDIEFQRKLVWKIEAKSRFIESILMGFPLPPFYLNAQPNGSYIIIDGLQRTTTLNTYLQDGFALSGLTGLPSLNGSNFSQLSPTLQAKIEDKGLNIYILKATTPSNVIYQLFERINTGGTPLSRQEVRNGIYIGKSTILLKELAEEDIFKTALDNSISDKRMKDREIVLRYLSFKIRGYENYSSDLSSFVEDTMQIINEMSNEQIEKLKVDFKNVMKWSSEIFGKHNFRIPVDNQGIIKKGFINVSVLESVGFAISQCSDKFLEENKEKIRANYFILTTNDEYLSAVKTSTGDRKKVKARFELAQKNLLKIKN